MPELPEVESLVRRIGPLLIGRRIVGAKIGWQRIVAQPSLKKFQAAIINRCFVNATRRGKYLVFELDSSFLLMHLRMSGNITVVASDVPPSKHEHLILILDDGKQLRFHDTRKFGRVYLVPGIDKVVGKLGPEPLDQQYLSETFCRELTAKKAVIKSLLLKQEFIAGVGNIYADESLWRAKIHPLRLASSLEATEAAALFRAIRLTLSEAIEVQGTDNGDNVVPEGDYEPRVYGREGQGCRRCRNKISKIVVGQRGTHFCENCQPLKKKKRPSR